MPDKYAMPDVIVVLPGILGSVLTHRDGHVVWGFSAATIAKALFTGGGSIRRALALPHDDPAVDDLGDGITATALMPDLHLLPGLWKIDGYTAITDMLLANFDLVEGHNFFRFPYDWRRDNRVAARQLALASHGWLRRWRDRGHPNARLVLLAHSMGGLVSRYFLECMEGWKDTRALITFGTPYRGSLNSLDTLANGLKMGPIDMTDAVREFTAVYQLLPAFECWDDGSGVLKRVDAVSGIPNVDVARAKAALDFHREIADAVKINHALPAFADNGYQTHPIVGIAQKTMLSAHLGPAGVLLSDLHRGGVTLGGDGTVPRVSAIPVEMSSNPAGAVYAATPHGSLQNADAALDHLTGVLTGLSINLGEFLKPKVQVALEIKDVIEAMAPIIVRAKPVRGEVALTAVLERNQGVKVAQSVMQAQTDGWFKAEFAPQTESGVYRVSVGGVGVETARDACVVIGE